jgi:hypothetical protein
MLALPRSDALLPSWYYKLRAIFCQGEKQKNPGWSGGAAEEKSKPAAFKPKAAAPDEFAVCE